tara:strand:- start:200 stop:775 length:576 start_codon:yes stop_codon:yes gene_type:complete
MEKVNVKFTTVKSGNTLTGDMALTGKNTQEKCSSIAIQIKEMAIAQIQSGTSVFDGFNFGQNFSIQLKYKGKKTFVNFTTDDNSRVSKNINNFVSKSKVTKTIDGKKVKVDKLSKGINSKAIGINLFKGFYKLQGEELLNYRMMKVNTLTANVLIQMETLLGKGGACPVIQDFKQVNLQGLECSNKTKLIG